MKLTSRYIKVGIGLVFVFVCQAGFVSAQVPVSPYWGWTAEPTWIWGEGDRDGEAQATLARTIKFRDEFARATLRVTADFADVDVVVNGRLAGKLEAYDPPRTIEIRAFLKPGDNRLELRGRGVAGPSAVAAHLYFATIDDGRLKHALSSKIQTDASWKTVTATEEKSALEFGAVDPRRWAPNRLSDITAFAEYNQWKEALANAEPLPAADRQRSTATGSPAAAAVFEVIHRAGEGEGSWVSMAFDAKGRVIIARETKGLLRLALPSDSRVMARVEVINDTLEECRGLVFREGDLFANANRSKALYRLRDTKGDDHFDEVIEWQATEGSTGHGRNDLALGPAGRIHAIHGDVVLVPETATLRTVEEPGDEAPKHLGHWVRTKGESPGEWEIMARGLRNPYGIDFNSDGEAFTYDADNEGDVGLPFYRPTRINHLVSGANYGWHQQRGNTRNLPVYAPDSVPTTFDVGRGSPTAVKFCNSERFPEKLRDALIALDWAYGRIIAVYLIPRGASYYGSGKVIERGRPLNVTDLEFGPDGALYFITGGRKTQSSLYRIKSTSAFLGAIGKGEAQFEQRDSFSRSARQRRVELEAYHGRSDPAAVEDLWSELGSADPWLRNAARVALESQSIGQWREKALRGDGDLQGLTGLMALARVGTETDHLKIVERLAALVKGPASKTEQLTFLRALEISINIQQVSDFKGIEEITDNLEAWYPATADEVNRELARILGKLESPLAVPLGLERMAAASDQLERLHYLEMLSEAPRGWTLEQRAHFFRKLVEAERSSRGDRFMAGFFDTVKRHSLATIRDDAERSRFAAMLEAKEEGPEATEFDEAMPQRPFVHHWTLDDLPADALQEELDGRKVDAGRGSELFSAALCSRCHVFGSEGRAVGPDLSLVGARFSPRDLLESIVDPSLVVASVHRNISIQLEDGSTVLGRIVSDDFRESKLTVATNPFDPRQVREISKGEIALTETSPVSPMPPALLDTLNRNEVLDLLAWLLAGGVAEPPATPP